MDTDTALSHEAERLALTLSQSGMQRTTARVMAALLFSQQETMTPADLCDALSISSGAVSGAIKQLIPLGLVERVPAPGSRRDHYAIPEGAWARLTSNQNQTMEVLHVAAQKGIEVAGTDSVAGRRLAEMQDFYAFILRELEPLIERWCAEYAAKSTS